MPTFKHSSGKRIFFAHIPRTAGRFVEANLSKNDFKWDDAHLDNGKGIMSIVNGFEVAHYHRDHYMKYLDTKDIPHFSIVRNPIDRFISASIYIKRFLFVHIPRTAGRFLEENFLDNGFEPEQKIWDSVDGIEIAHFDRSLYERYFDIKDIPHFTIVRNPIDRFFGCSIFLKRMYGDDIQELMEDKMMFYQMLQNFPLSQAVNWFRPQVDFLTSETNIWKFEDGFGEDFVSWLSGIVGIDLEFTDDVEYAVAPDEGNKLEKTPQLIDTLIHFYKQDIEQFYPELAA